ncbi:AcrR family transcriptional regulator [Streptosporangium becharense]|uniref:AcrR family transcriptional regulator n=1 Tax=Streptosporangium becharense TaxID=1816182 RepID=A0A7W9MHP4_9ACTN|nr:helix-turn-helix domain-containing protein [Streptosporangium becharense]MBB2912506.1 AcrR family transcriptional regulator [Streptosporangium becharense]MBB5820664.1 AcrR family transcriptional regulator [Streptosporangium becharense]
MPPRPETTGKLLVAAAERLFAERGIDGVSLREINAAAGQRNATALQYHFGDRAGLLSAVLAKHHPEIEARRHQLLDEYESRGGLPEAEARRALAAALVRPMAAKLADPDGGRPYLRIMEQLVQRGDPVALRSGQDDPGQSINRWRELVAPLLPEVAVRRLHQRFMAIRVTYVELARRAAGPEGKDDRLFTSHLIDVVSAVLATEVSEETARLLGERDRRPGGEHGGPGDDRDRR